MNDIKLPDFDELFNIINSVYELSKKKALLEIEIKLKESEITIKATSDEKYFQGNKPPSQTYIDNAWKYSGFNGELIPLRKELAEITSQLEFFKMKYYLYTNIMDVWRTHEASKRALT